MRQWPDRFIHPRLTDDPETLRRARLTVLLSVVLIGVALVYAAFYAVIGYHAGARILVAGGASVVLALAALRRRPWLPLVGQLGTATLYGVILGLTICEGGIRALAIPLLCTPPMLAVLLLGRRAAVAWTALVVATVVAFGVLDMRGVHLPHRYPAAWEANMNVGSPVGLIICTTLLLFVFERARADAQARADAAGAELARMAYRDALTGLANRARFLACVERAIARARTAGDPSRIAVLLLDLDGFKAVNDTMGHAAGDALLQVVAARLLDATRGSDTVARLGGDEFAILLDGVRDDADAAVVADRVVASVGRAYALVEGEARIGASLGVARGAADGARAEPAGEPDATDAIGEVAALLRDADVAMYHAKSLGRGRWVRHAPGMGAAPPGRQRLVPVGPPMEPIVGW